MPVSSSKSVKNRLIWEPFVQVSRGDYLLDGDLFVRYCLDLEVLSFWESMDL